jgi:ribosomal protein L40E
MLLTCVVCFALLRPVKRTANPCPSCRSSLDHPLHEQRHARYLERHRLAVRVKQQKYKTQKGICVRCGAKTNLYAGVCDRHGLLTRKYVRRANRNKPWKPGGKGRIPLVPEPLEKPPRKVALAQHRHSSIQPK